MLSLSNYIEIIGILPEMPKLSGKIQTFFVVNYKFFKQTHNDY